MKESTNRIDQLFSQKGDNSKIASLFITAGYPDLDSTVDLIVGLAESGADMIELGIPFSDPLADGPTIQQANNVALENGVTMEKILAYVAEARQYTPVPIVLMGYLNPILKYGVEGFCRRAEKAGVDGLIIPDLPPDESNLLGKKAMARHLKIIYLIAPNTTDKRMKLIDNKSQGFVYCVSVTGVTGAREEGQVEKSVDQFIGRVQTNITQNPILVGFGIKSHEEAQKVSAKADGFIVGSALINTIKEYYPSSNWKANTFNFVQQLKYGND